MSKRHVSGTARIIYQVLIQPSLSPARTLRTPTGTVAPIPKSHTTPSLVHRRTYAWRKAKAEPVQSYFTLDEMIGSRLIRLIDDDGICHEDQRLDMVLRGFNRVTHHLVMMVPASETEPPTCKVHTKTEVHEMEQRKQHDKTKKSAESFNKAIELNWTVGEHDLAHWMNRMTQFLEEGRRVEVGFGPKKRARQATIAECEALVDKVKKTLESVNGVQWTAPEGTIGGEYTLFCDPNPEVKERFKALKREATQDSDEKKLRKRLAKDAEREKQRIRAERARAARERLSLNMEGVGIETSAQGAKTLATPAPGTVASYTKTATQQESEPETSSIAVPKLSRWKLKEEKRRMEEEARLLQQNQNQPGSDATRW